MSTSCAVWRREIVVDSGLRFDPFFRDFGVLEDAHFSLRARRKKWHPPAVRRCSLRSSPCARWKSRHPQARLQGRRQLLLRLPRDRRAARVEAPGAILEISGVRVPQDHRFRHSSAPVVGRVGTAGPNRRCPRRGPRRVGRSHLIHLAVFSHKLCWRDSAGREGYATDGGFPFQMRALAELFDSTTLVLPCRQSMGHESNTRLSGHQLTVVPLTVPSGQDGSRKLLFPVWLLRNLPVLIKETLRADAVHAPIPGDIGTIGMLLAVLFRKPLFVRHCGNWYVQATPAEHFWKWFMQLMAGGANVMLATGGGQAPPSARNAALRSISSSACTQRELQLAAQRAAAREPGHRLIIACRQE